MIKKISLPVLVTVMCVMVSVVVGLYWLNQQKQVKTKRVTQKITIETTTEVNRTDYSLVARKTLDWIDKQRNDQGWYILERGCDFETKTCDTVWDNQEGNKDGLIATWARFNFYNQTKDPSDLEIVKNDINKFYEKYPDGVDNTLWICKITYDMWQSDLFDQTTKDKLKDICFKSKFEKIVENKFDYEKDYKKGIELLNKNKKVWETWQGYSYALRGVDNYFGITSDLISQYLWTKDEYKIDLAKKYFEGAKKIIEEQGEFVKAENDCLIGLSAIDLYEYGGKNEIYLNYVKEKYLSVIGENNTIKKYRTVICGLLTKRLRQIDKNQVFRDGLNRNNKLLVDNLLDGEDSLVNKTGNDGFFVTYNGGFSFQFKDVAENGLVVELLRD